MKIYLAARYSRRLELVGYKKQLEAMGLAVQARWLDGSHQVSNEGTPIGDNGEALVEAGGEEAAALRTKFARDDWEDVRDADMVINFTEPPRSTAMWNLGSPWRWERLWWSWVTVKTSSIPFRKSNFARTGRAQRNGLRHSADRGDERVLTREGGEVMARGGVARLR